VVGASTRRGSSGRIVYHALSQRSPLQSLMGEAPRTSQRCCWTTIILAGVKKQWTSRRRPNLYFVPLIYRSPSQTDKIKVAGDASRGLLATSAAHSLGMAARSRLDATTSLISQVTFDELCCSGTEYNHIGLESCPSHKDLRLDKRHASLLAHPCQWYVPILISL